ncbi:MAG: hypothetical protein V2B15_13685 [Bacteroidota bacterium]
MKSVDHMIKYLSGDLNGEDSGSLEKELLQDKELHELFEQVSAAYRLIGDQLRKRDEDLFRSRLREVMDKTSPADDPGVKKRRPLWLLIPTLAASVAILLAILMMHRSPDQRYQAFYHPNEDQVILALNTETRSDSESAAFLFSKGEFQSTLKLTSAILKTDPGDQAALLFHLLASMELDLEREALAITEKAVPDTSHALGQAMVWYRTLALMKAGREDEAEIALEALLKSPGSYAADAHKLKKMLTK